MTTPPPLLTYIICVQFPRSFVNLGDGKAASTAVSDVGDGGVDRVESSAGTGAVEPRPCSSSGDAEGIEEREGDIEMLPSSGAAGFSSSSGSSDARHFA